MKRLFKFFRLAAPAIVICSVTFCAAPTTSADTPVRVMAYYTGYRQAKLAPSQVDYSAVSYIAHFAVVPNADGSIKVNAHGITTANSEDLIARAHAAGRAVLLCVGGADSASAFKPAIADPAFRTALVNNLVLALTPGGYSDGTNKVANYDGIDIDLEPITNGNNGKDKADFQNFINELRDAMDVHYPNTLLTMATPQGTSPGNANYPPIFDGIQNRFDQMNVMTYAQSGPWSKGWTTWHSGELWDTHTQIPNSTTYYPSAQRSLGMYLSYRNSAGQPIYTTASGKMGIGIGFFSQEWLGVSDIKQPVKLDENGKVITTLKEANYDDVMNHIENDGYTLKRDASTSFGATSGGVPSGEGAPYLSYHDANNPANDRFVSFEDPILMRAKIDFARRNNLGVIIWMLADGYRPNSPVKDPLLQAVKSAAQPVGTYPLPDRKAAF